MCSRPDKNMLSMNLTSFSDSPYRDYVSLSHNWHIPTQEMQMGYRRFTSLAIESWDGEGSSHPWWPQTSTNASGLKKLVSIFFLWALPSPTALDQARPREPQVLPGQTGAGTKASSSGTGSMSTAPASSRPLSQVSIWWFCVGLAGSKFLLSKEG